MSKAERNEALSALRQLEACDSTSSGAQAERLFVKVIQPLLAEDGYRLQRQSASGDRGFDILVDRPPSADYEGQTLGVEFKRYPSNRPASFEGFASALVKAIANDVDRVVVYSNGGFTRRTHATVEHEFPLQVELLSADTIRARLNRVGVEEEKIALEVRQILQVVSREFATLIARDPRTLEELEWRDLERVVAEVFDGLGFSVELTRPANDLGKDVVLECRVEGKDADYIVEIKHWRCRSRVGGRAVTDFLKVILAEERDGGLFLSTYGYCHNAFGQLSEIDRQRLRFGDKKKIVALCRTYVRARAGIWSPPENLAEVLYEETI